MQLHLFLWRIKYLSIPVQLPTKGITLLVFIQKLSKPRNVLASQASVALGKYFGKFIDFAVKISSSQKLAKHQRHCSARVGQADFRKSELNKRNHSDNCQHLSVEEKKRIFMTQTNERVSPSVHVQ